MKQQKSQTGTDKREEPSETSDTGETHQGVAANQHNDQPAGNRK